jgi:hypothetical protein
MANDDEKKELKWPLDLEPNEVLLKFLDELPATIKETVLFHCKFAISDRTLTGIAPDSSKMVQQFLAGERKGPDLAYNCAMLVGVLEMILVNEPGEIEELNTRLFEETGFEEFRQIALRQPLADKHREAAYVRFQELRKRDLSGPVLHLWSKYLDW